VADAGYPHSANADETRQAQHSVSNDAPTDVNINAVVGRSQALTVDIAGKAFTSNQDRRDKIADIIMSRIGVAASDAKS